MKKIVARKKVGKIELVQYHGDPPHRWYRITPVTPTQKRVNKRVSQQVKKDLEEMGYHPRASSLVAIGQEIRQAREAQGLSLGNLAQQSGLEKASISRIESGKNPNPSLRTLSRLAKALNKSLEVRFH